MNPSSLVVHACLVFCFVGCNGQDVLAQLTLDQAIAELNALPKLAKPLDLWPLHPTQQRSAALLKALTDKLGAVTLRPRELAEGLVEVPPKGIPWALMDQPHQLAATAPVTTATCDQVTRDSFQIMQVVQRKALAAGNLPLRIWIDDEWAVPAGWSGDAWRTETIRRQAIHDATYAQFFPAAKRIWYSSGQSNGQHVPVRLGTHDGLVVYYPDVPSINDAILVANHPLLSGGTGGSGTGVPPVSVVTPAGLWLSLRWSNYGGAFRGDIAPANHEWLGLRFAGRGDAARDTAQVGWNRAEFGLLYDHRDPGRDGVNHPRLWCFDPTDPTVIAALKACAKGAAK